MEKAIKKAIEGGYLMNYGNGKPPYKWSYSVDKISYQYNEATDRQYISVYQVLMDKDFWQALGKAEGWDSKKDVPKDYMTYFEATGEHYYNYQWHQFINHLNMKNFLVGWIVFQLLVIGISGGRVMNNCLRGIKQPLPEPGFSSYFVSIAVPLAWFATNIASECINPYQ